MVCEFYLNKAVIFLKRSSSSSQLPRSPRNQHINIKKVSVSRLKEPTKCPGPGCQGAQIIYHYHPNPSQDSPQQLGVLPAVSSQLCLSGTCPQPKGAASPTSFSGIAPVQGRGRCGCTMAHPVSVWGNSQLRAVHSCISHPSQAQFQNHCLINTGHKSLSQDQHPGDLTQYTIMAQL